MDKDLETSIAEASGKEDQYIFHCEVKKIKVQVATPISDSRGQESSYETDVAILIPDTTETSFNQFMNAYYEDDELPNMEEFIAALPYPIKSDVRLSFDSENELCNKLHFMVMSEQPDEDLRKHLLDKRVEIKIMQDSYEGQRELDI